MAPAGWTETGETYAAKIDDLLRMQLQALIDRTGEVFYQPCGHETAHCPAAAADLF
jgi:hypothetical protein